MAEFYAQSDLPAALIDSPTTGQTCDVSPRISRVRTESYFAMGYGKFVIRLSGWSEDRRNFEKFQLN